MLTALPRDALLAILAHLPPPSLQRLREACRSLCRAASDDSLWARHYAAVPPWRPCGAPLPHARPHPPAAPSARQLLVASRLPCDRCSRARHSPRAWFASHASVQSARRRLAASLWMGAAARRSLPPAHAHVVVWAVHAHEGEEEAAAVRTRRWSGSACEAAEELRECALVLRRRAHPRWVRVEECAEAEAAAAAEGAGASHPVDEHLATEWICPAAWRRIERWVRAREAGEQLQGPRPSATFAARLQHQLLDSKQALDCLLNGEYLFLLRVANPERVGEKGDRLHVRAVIHAPSVAGGLDQTQTMLLLDDIHELHGR
ncbi:hypothetical protein AB1Y20_006853 [Prymnesium parvum]|uniref:F-box domain-containing protein n=1 Tax=Prymnesium parvum TaxID=97485 RepID=A0AB34J1U7_PRYPA